MQPHVAPPALGTGSAQGMRSAAAAHAGTCAQPLNKVRTQPPGLRCCMGVMETLPWGRTWAGAATGQALRVLGCSPQGRRVPAVQGVPVPVPAAPSHPSDKPGECPRVRPQQPPELCEEEDSCAHDRDCPRQEKCCFSGCAMRCARPARGERGQPRPCMGHSVCGTCTLSRSLPAQSTPGSARRQSHAGTRGTGAGASAWMTASAGERRSAATPAAPGSVWPCPEVAGAFLPGGAGHQPPRVAA